MSTELRVVPHKLNNWMWLL